VHLIIDALDKRAAGHLQDAVTGLFHLWSPFIVPAITMAAASQPLRKMLAASSICARASTWAILNGPCGSVSTPSQTDANSSRPPRARPRASRRVPDADG